MPNERKPHHLRLIQGTDKPSRRPPETVEFRPVESIPEPPDWLPAPHAVSEWRRLAPELIQAGVLTEVSLSAFGMLCAIHSKIVGMYSLGEGPTGHMLAQYRALCNDFGLTPIGQQRLHAVTKTEKRPNPFARNGTRSRTEAASVSGSSPEEREPVSGEQDD